MVGYARHVCRAGVILRVTTVTSGGSAGELPVNVAQIAGDVHVSAGERKGGLAVVKGSGHPGSCRMAPLALL